MRVVVVEASQSNELDTCDELNVHKLASFILTVQLLKRATFLILFLGEGRGGEYGCTPILVL